MNLLLGKLILVVDDEALIREVMLEEFELEGAEVVTAQGGNEAFRLLLKRSFDAVVSDVRMPDGDGLSLVRNIRTKLSSPPKLFLCTGYNDLSEEEVKKMGVERLLEKPVSLAEMITIISKALK